MRQHMQLHEMDTYRLDLHHKLGLRGILKYSWKRKRKIQSVYANPQKCKFMWCHNYTVHKTCSIPWQKGMKVLTLITVAPFPSGFTLAGIVIYQVNTFKSVRTRIWCTLIYICWTRTRTIRIQLKLWKNNKDILFV